MGFVGHAGMAGRSPWWILFPFLLVFSSVVDASEQVGANSIFQQLAFSDHNESWSSRLSESTPRPIHFVPQRFRERVRLFDLHGRALINVPLANGEFAQALESYTRGPPAAGVSSSTVS